MLLRVEREMMERAQAIASRSSRLTPASILEQALADGLGAMEARIEQQDKHMLEAFAEQVLQAADSRRATRFGDEVFISSIWRQISKHFRTRAAFDAYLLLANQHGLLRLSRADLVGAMPEKEVRESEIQHPDGATFHFVVRR